MIPSSSLPVVRLRPKANARAIRYGFPWVYDDELVADRRTRALAPGSLAILEDSERARLGVVAVTTGSRIVARMLDRNPDATIDAAWLRVRLERALAHRELLHEEPFYRLVHAEADGLPGVAIDRYGDSAAIQPNAAWADRMYPELAEAVQAVTGIPNLVKNAGGRGRALEGLDGESLVTHGRVDGPVSTTMNGATYLADLIGGQKTGLFLDQRPNHAFVRRLAGGARVLDAFSHVGGFALACLAGGAESALAVDSSGSALELASEGAALSGVAGKLSVRRSDAFQALQTLAEEGAEFDLAICDPPSFAPTKQALETGLRAYERLAQLAARLVVPGGYLALCSCSHAADLARFRAACVRGIGRAGRSAMLIRVGFAGPDHPLLPQLPESGYLKALFFRLVA